MYWLIDTTALESMRQAAEAGVYNAEAAERWAVDAAARGPQELRVAGGVAHIAVSGALTKRPDWLAQFFGGGNTTYGDIIAQLAAADASPDVKSAVLQIASPGGTVDGLFDAIAALQAFSKPVVAHVEDLAASAAYALAAQTDSIRLNNKAARVGSVGVVASFYAGASTVSITSTKAPKKRPNPTTEEGAEMIREELDALHELFADAIATGRGVSVAKVDKDFGQGAVVLADDAIARGMADTVAEWSPRVVKSAQSTPATTAEAQVMDLKQLKTAHPEAYEAAFAEGITAERKRCKAHLTLGKSAGIMDYATAAIESGAELDVEVMAHYQAAGMNRQDQQRRQDDSDEAAAATAAAAPAATSAGDLNEQAADLVLQQLGSAQ